MTVEKSKTRPAGPQSWINASVVKWGIALFILAFGAFQALSAVYHSGFLNLNWNDKVSARMASVPEGACLAQVDEYERYLYGLSNVYYPFSAFDVPEWDNLKGDGMKIEDKTGNILIASGTIVGVVSNYQGSSEVLVFDNQGHVLQELPTLWLKSHELKPLVIEGNCNYERLGQPMR